MATLPFDEAERRWLVSPLGLLAACRDAVADGDAGFFDEVTSPSFLGRLDDESLRSTGPPPSARAMALISAARLASWCQGLDVESARLLQCLEVAIAGFSSTALPSGPGSPPWSASAGIEAVDQTITDPRARAVALVDAVPSGPSGQALLAVRDLLLHFLGALDAPAATGSARVLILTSRHREGELVHLVVMEREGPPGIALDPLAGPFTRPGPAFASAMETAWRASRPPTSSARWAVTSERTGAPVEVIDGRSVGAGAALALRYLGRSGLPPLDPSWAVTGAVDSAGVLGSLLDDDRDLTTYRAKLAAAQDRAVVVPRSDHPHLLGLVESGNLSARLVPAATVDEIIEAAKRDVAGRHAYRRAVEEPVADRGVGQERRPDLPAAVDGATTVPSRGGRRTKDWRWLLSEWTPGSPTMTRRSPQGGTRQRPVRRAFTRRTGRSGYGAARPSGPEPGWPSG